MGRRGHWPGGEVTGRPIHFVKRLEGLSEGQIRLIMRDNAAELFGISG